MRIADRLLAFMAALCLFNAAATAAAPPPEQLLPSDTLGFFTVPDWDKAAAEFKASPQTKLWDDPSMKAFRDKFETKFKKDLIEPLERELGIKCSDYISLLHGQVTFALGAPDRENPDKAPAFFLLLDSKNQRDALKKQLSGLKQKWTDAGKQTKSEKVRDVEFTTLVVKKADLKKLAEKIFPSGESDEPDPEGSFEISFGQADSVLVITSAPKQSEKILARLSGGQVAPVSEQSNYQPIHNAMFRNSMAFAWINFAPIYQMLAVKAKASAPENPEETPFGLQPEKVLSAIGLAGLQTIAFQFSSAADGSNAELFLGIPESGRQGVFKILGPEAKDASPPAFVPADAIKFNRWRLDGKKAWGVIESTLNGISPQLGGMLQLIMNSAGKDKDPDFDLRRNLIGNLGDDIITFEKAPKNHTFADFNSPPSLFMIGSPNPEQLAQAIKTSAGLLPLATGQGGNPLREREFLGRKIYQLTFPTPPQEEGAGPGSQTLSFAAGGPYVALSTDAAMLESYLRSSDAGAKSLKDTPGLNEAAQKVGGSNTGFFGYENQKETMRALLETFRKDSASLEKQFQTGFNIGPGNPGEQLKSLKDWFDFSLLPPFTQLEKYFSHMVYGGSTRAEGISWKFYTPNPK